MLIIAITALLAASTANVPEPPVSQERIAQPAFVFDDQKQTYSLTEKRKGKR